MGFVGAGTKQRGARGPGCCFCAQRKGSGVRASRRSEGPARAAAHAENKERGHGFRGLRQCGSGGVRNRGERKEGWNSGCRGVLGFRKMGHVAELSSPVRGERERRVEWREGLMGAGFEAVGKVRGRGVTWRARVG